MIRQGPVSETKPSRFADDVNDATCIQRPHPEGTRLNRDRRADFNRNTTRHNRHPAEIKLLPVLQQLNRAVETRLTFSELNAIVIDGVSLRRSRVRSTNFRVREWQLALTGDETCYICFARLSNPKHPVNLVILSKT